jgi:precorrin-6A synthase
MTSPLKAVQAIRRADVFILLDKGPAAADLAALRRLLLDRYTPGRYRLVEVSDPDRDRDAPGYVEAVEDWRLRRVDLYERLLRDEVPPGGCGAFLVWGDRRSTTARSRSCGRSRRAAASK